jgi:hypothetical protein
MYRIIKRIVRTITTVTWSVHWGPEPVSMEKAARQTSVSQTEEVAQEVVIRLSKNAHPKFISTQDQGEKL